MVARLAVQKVMDSIKKMENGIIKIRYLIGCGVRKIRRGEIYLILNVCRVRKSCQHSVFSAI